MPDTINKHQISDSTLLLQYDVIFNGDLISNNGRISIYDSVYNGDILSFQDKGIGNLTLINSTVNGSIKTGDGNNGNLVLMKNASINSNESSALSGKSGQLVIMDSDFSSGAFATIMSDHTESLLLQNVNIATGGAIGLLAGAVDVSITNFTLKIANTGKEPANDQARLNVVETGGGNALFYVDGGKVDAGVWQYELLKDGNNGYLGSENHAPTEEGEDNTPGESNTPPPSGATPSRPTTSASTDAVLNIASAPAYIFNSELSNTRQRRGSLAGKE